MVHSQLAKGMPAAVSSLHRLRELEFFPQYLNLVRSITDSQANGIAQVVADKLKGEIADLQHGAAFTKVRAHSRHFA